MLLSFFRAIKFSFQNVVRNIWLSLVTIIILILTLFIVNTLLVVKVIGNTAVDTIHQKIDVNLFLKSDVQKDKIESLKAKIESLAEVKEVRYVSKEEAMEEFKISHKNNPEILEALYALGKNPLTPTLIIKPDNIEMFDDLINQLNAIEDDIIESRNFSNYQSMLDKISLITKKVTDAAFALSLVFLFITLMVIYNSVRVAIYTHKREISIMKLVGASNWFIQVPYLLSSVIYTLIGLLFVMLAFWPLLNLLQPYLETFFVSYNVDLIEYFYGNWMQIFGIQFLVVAFINILASLLAVRKYSNV